MKRIPSLILFLLFIASAARGAVAFTNKFWICTNATGQFYSSGAGGTIDNPFDGSSQANFDSNMNSLPANSTIHILAGTYQTKGYWGGFSLHSGQKILGSGMDVTIVQYTAGLTIGGSGAQMFLNPTPGTNIEICDLTCDGNIANSTASETYSGIFLDGTENAVHRVHVKNMRKGGGSTEAWGIVLSNNSLLDSQGNIIEGCIVSDYQGGSANESAVCMLTGANALPISGDVSDNTIIGNLPLTGAAPVFAIIAGRCNSLVQGNHVINCANIMHTDSGGAYTNLIVSHNFFDNCYKVLDFEGGISANVTLAYNNIIMATNVDSAVIYSGNITNLIVQGNTITLAGDVIPPP